MLCFSSSFFSRFLADLSSIWAPFWPHLGVFFSPKNVAFLRAAPLGGQGALFDDLERFGGAFGMIFG